MPSLCSHTPCLLLEAPPKQPERALVWSSTWGHCTRKSQTPKWRVRLPPSDITNWFQWKKRENGNKIFLNMHMIVWGFTGVWTIGPGRTISPLNVASCVWQTGQSPWAKSPREPEDSSPGCLGLLGKAQAGPPLACGCCAAGKCAAVCQVDLLACQDRWS